MTTSWHYMPSLVNFTYHSKQAMNRPFQTLRARYV